MRKRSWGGGVRPRRSSFFAVYVARMNSASGNDCASGLQRLSKPRLFCFRLSASVEASRAGPRGGTPLLLPLFDVSCRLPPRCPGLSNPRLTDPILRFSAASSEVRSFSLTISQTFCRLRSARLRRPRRTTLRPRPLRMPASVTHFR
jgi:hypothetical protein